MLYLDSSLELNGLTLFRDYNASNRFYYLPKSPHLTTEGGQPLFQLLVYRRDITDNPDFREGDRPGGGFLTMTVDLGVPQATLDAVRAELAGRVSGGIVELVPVPVENGTVRVSALGASSAAPAAAAAGDGAPAGPRFVENIIGSTRPSMYGDNRAVFTMELSHEGAQLMRASLQDGGATQVAVVYELDYRGLLPAYEAKIRIDFRQSYSHLRTRFALNTLWFKADVDNEVERLMKEGHIKIEEVDYLETDPVKMADRAQKLQALAKELATWSFFRPGLTPGKVLADDRGNLTLHDPTTAASQVTAGFGAPLRAAATGTGSPGDVAGPRTPGDSANPATSRVGGTVPPPPGAGAAAQESDPGSAPTAVEAWNRAGRPQAAFLLRQLSQEEQQTITFDLRQVSATRRTAAPQGSIRVLPGASKLAGRIKEVDLNDPFFEKIAGTVTTTADLVAAGVTSMVVKLRYGTRDDGSTPKDTAEFTLTKAGDKGSYAFFMDRRRSVELEYQVVVSYKAGFAIGSTDTQVTSPWIRTSTRNLDIDPRSIGAVFAVNLVLGNVDFSSIQTVQSVVSYEHGSVRGERTVVLQPGAGATGVVPVRPAAGGSRKFKARHTFFYGSVTEVVEVEGEGEATVVVNPPTTRAVPVSISAADPLGRFRKVAVELAYAPPGAPEQTKLVELTGDGTAAAWVFFRPSDQSEPKYRFRTTLFGKDGTTTTGEWQPTLERQLIVGDRFEEILEVEVRLLVPDFASLGLLGAKLRLEYPEAPPQVKASVEKFLSGVPEPFTWRVPRKRGSSRQYRYSIQWVRANSTTVAAGPVTTEDEVLLIFPPVGG